MVKNQAKQRQSEYLSHLTKQMVEQRTKKKYDTLMTEHERRINDKDIKAYEEINTKDLNCKIPGIRSND